MNIWTFDKGLMALALCALAACSEDGGLFSEGAEPPPRPNTALVSAEMARGAVKIVPPNGFCIDKRGLRQDFAILARCDSLGGKGGAQDAPLGFIAVSVAPMVTELTAADALLVAGEGAVTLAQSVTGQATILHLEGPTPAGTDPKHWKAVMPIGAFAVSFSAFGPPGGALALSEGGLLLASLMQRTEDASIALDVAEPQPERTGFGELLSGLFD